MNTLTTSNLEDSLYLEEKLRETSEKNWEKIKRIACGIIRSCLTQDIKYHMLHETSTRKI